MIRLYTFGAPSVVSSDGGRLDDLLRHTKRLAILIYLAANERKLCRRDELMGVFWPDSDESDARNCLRQSLHVLRKQLGPEVIQSDGDQVLCVDEELLESDAGAFLTALQEGLPEVALSLYRGSFLQGFHLGDTPEFERWVDGRREELRRIALAAAKHLAHRAEGSRDSGEALHWWRRAAELAPFDEAVARRVASLLIAVGNRAEAIHSLKEFRRRVDDELRVAPSDETIDFLEAARKGARPALPSGYGNRRTEEASRHPVHHRRLSDGLRAGDWRSPRTAGSAPT